MEALSAIALTASLGFAASAGFLLASQAAARATPKGRKKAPANGSRNEKGLKTSVENILLRLPHLGQLVERARAERRRVEIRQSMPEALRLMGIALGSGSSLSKALEYAASNSSGAMAQELRKAVWDMRAGQGFDEAMERLRMRSGGAEFAYLAVAMEIQHKCGGALSGVINSVSQMLQQSAELQENLVTKTSQARLSARVVALMPLGVLALLSLLSPGYLGVFFSSAAGLFVLLFAVVLEVVGVLLVRKFLAVDSGMEEEL